MMRAGMGAGLRAGHRLMLNMLILHMLMLHVAMPPGHLRSSGCPWYLFS
jgi:hypothetical protein